MKIYEFIKSNKILQKERGMDLKKSVGKKAIHSEKKKDKFVKNSLEPPNFVKKKSLKRARNSWEKKKWACGQKW